MHHFFSIFGNVPYKIIHREQKFLFPTDFLYSQNRYQRFFSLFMPFFFYLARCADHSLYAGYTNDLKKREEAHNSGKGARYTASRRPVSIIYSESFETKEEAMSREGKVKRWPKKRKEELIFPL